MARHCGKKEEKKLKKSKIIFFILLILILLVVLVIFLNKNKTDEKNIAKNNSNNLQNQDSNLSPEENGESENLNLEIPEKMGSYNVIGAIVIDKIGITKNILETYTDEALNLSVTRFYGPNQVNQVGNLCITGHNYKDTFAELNNLEINDTFYIVDKNNSQKVTYKVYDKYTVEPKELDCLDQQTDGKKEVTIITCNPGALTRLIVKAQEV